MTDYGLPPALVTLLFFVVTLFRIYLLRSHQMYLLHIRLATRPGLQVW